MVAKKIQLRVADELFEDLDMEFPDMEMRSEDIQKEINSYRNARKKKN